MTFLTAFLSHARADRTFVERVADALTRRGILVWLDSEQLVLGGDLSGELRRSIERQSTIVTFVSESAITREWVNDEWAHAIERSERDPESVLPVFMGAPLALVQRHDVLRRHWLHPDGDRVKKLGHVVSSETPTDEDSEQAAREIARAIYARHELSEQREVAVVLDQRGDGTRIGEPPGLTPAIRSLEIPCLVFRPDRGSRANKETLTGEAWEAFVGDIDESLRAGLSGEQGKTVRLLGRSQLALPLWFGRRLQRSTWTILFAYGGPRAECFSNKGWGFLAPPQGGDAACTKRTPHLTPPKTGAACPHIALALCPANRLLDIRDYLKSVDAAPKHGLWIETGILASSDQVKTLVANSVALLEELRDRFGTRRVSLFSALPFHALPLLGAALDQVGVQLTFMEYAAGQDKSLSPAETYVGIEL